MEKDQKERKKMSVKSLDSQGKYAEPTHLSDLSGCVLSTEADRAQRASTPRKSATLRWLSRTTGGLRMGGGDNREFKARFYAVRGFASQNFHAARGSRGVAQSRQAQARPWEEYGKHDGATSMTPARHRSSEVSLMISISPCRTASNVRAPNCRRSV